MAQSYSDKLKNPKWQKKRLEIFNSRGFKCEECGDTESELHVHHRFYIKGRKPWEYDNDVFQVLCCNCHEKEHEEKAEVIEVVPKKYEELIKIIEEAEFFDNDLLEDFISALNSFRDDYGEITRLVECLSHASTYNLYQEFLNRAFDVDRAERQEISIWNLQKEIEELKQQING